MMSADRSVEVGAAFLALGGATVLARASYVWSSGGHFWDVWSVLGVVVGGLGLVIMAAGWWMPDKKSSPGQVQTGGAGSTLLQAGGDINLAGRDISPPHDDQSGE